MYFQKSVTILLFCLASAFAWSCQQEAKPEFDSAAVRDYASSLYNRQLYAQAIGEYQYYLDTYKPGAAEAANINYNIANIYFERVKDYENALTFYLRIKHFYSDSPLIDEVNKRMVECLERLDRSADAQQVAEESALLDPTQAKKRRPGEVIAKIGKRTITTGDLEHEISQLPSYMKSQLTERSQKIDFLRQYIATELLYDTAKRRGLEKDQGVIEGAFQAKKNLMVQKLLEEEISKDVNVAESDAELYYKAHRDRYVEKNEKGEVVRTKALDEVRQQVMQELIREKQQEAYNKLVQRMMRAESVDIYEDKL